MGKTKREYETADYAAMMRRMMKAHGRRVAEGDVEDLQELMELQTYLDYIVRGAVQAQRDEQGKSWADIARAAGTSRQAAQKKYSA